MPATARAVGAQPRHGLSWPRHGGAAAPPGRRLEGTGYPYPKGDMPEAGAPSLNFSPSWPLTQGRPRRTLRQ
jgi:hypothetical protein